MIFAATIRRHGWLKITLLLLDWLAVTLAAVTTLLLHYFVGFDQYDIEHSLGEYILRVAILYASFPILVLIFRQNMLYKAKVYATGLMQFAQLLRAILINDVLLIAVFFFVREDWILHSRINLLLFTLSSLVLLSFFRLIVFRRLLLPAIAGIEARRILLVGMSDEARELLAQSAQAQGRPFEIVAIVDRKGILTREPELVMSRTQAYNVPMVMATVPSLREYVPANNIHEVIVAENDLPYEEVVRLIREATEFAIPIHLLSDHFKVIQERVTKSTSEFMNVTAASIAHGIHGFYGAYLKRALDITASVIGLLILSPFFALVAVVIKSSTRGPLFFQTDVVGKNGGVFRWYKFRTMFLGGNDEIHRDHVAEHIRIGSRPTGKIEADRRVTPIGRWLRKHSLDELPQLWNVLRGDMSLIGPRPCLPYEYEAYEVWHKERFTSRPGMTGLWQVSGRSAVSFNDMVILDLYYIHNISLWLDAAILLRTIGVVLTGKGGG